MKNKIFSLLTIFGTFLIATAAFAADGKAGGSSNYAWFAIAAAIAIGLPAFGGAMGQGRAASAALEGIARNPGASGKIFVPMILGMALIESLVLFGLLMAFILSGNIGK
ncbi:ATP synthase F0 subunit C [Sulfobacillus acidophilus]|uniref:ATP synthase subunit c n=1 Tax=Sulfobacillus acidophilus TaxID=53633 RepID=A0ABS3AWM2_9FIRM|nr:ATP synthase F0 subunit C [Sulfobacillus acidophilus]